MVSEVPWARAAASQNLHGLQGSAAALPFHSHDQVLHKRFRCKPMAPVAPQIQVLRVLGVLRVLRVRRVLRVLRDWNGRAGANGPTLCHSEPGICPSKHWSSLPDF